MWLLIHYIHRKPRHSKIHHRIVYVPMYYIESVYHEGANANRYLFVVNAETGKRAAQRPWGLGVVADSWSRAIGLLMESFGFSDFHESHERPTFIRGIDMRRSQRSRRFNLSHPFLWFPASASYIFYWATGFIEVRNLSSEDTLQLVSRRRGTYSGQIGGSCEVKPESTVLFNYRGSWCIEVVKGSHTNLQVVSYEISSDLQGSNELGMANLWWEQTPWWPWLKSVTTTIVNAYDMLNRHIFRHARPLCDKAFVQLEEQAPGLHANLLDLKRKVSSLGFIRQGAQLFQKSFSALPVLPSPVDNSHPKAD